MARKSDYGLMIWDCKSTGTLSNVIELLKEKKKSVVFVNKNTDFITISDKEGLDHLLTFMSAHARAKAENKIGLSSKMASIEHKQFSFDVLDTSHSSSAQNAIPNTTEANRNNSDQTESVKLRSALMSTLKEHIARAHLSQSEAAKVFGVTQPRISDLSRGKVDLFGLDALVNMAALAGLHVELRVREAEQSTTISPMRASLEP
tara:strand:- start:1120 stop:1731 length:612 start_codon:yes stop_codon:yes gene_type:complete